MTMEFTLKEIEVTKLSLQPGDILSVTIKSDEIDESQINGIKEGLSKYFPKNQVVIFGLGPDDEVRFTTLNQPSSFGCGTQSYCSDCTCGKKEQAENK